MKGYSKMSQLLKGCLLQFIPLCLYAQVSLPPIPPSSPSMLPGFNQETNSPSYSSQDRNNPSTLSSPESIIPTDRPSEILDFWFGNLSSPADFPEDKLDVWFTASPEVDRQIRDQFTQDVLNAERGEYNQWRQTPRGRLALILLLDQIPRHIYRNQSQSFLLDRMAQSLVVEGIQKGDDQALYPIERAFFYLPLEHSENVGLQNLSVRSYQQLMATSPEPIRPEMQDFLKAAIVHQQHIARFGRFPYRNAILGRESTPEETVFLLQWSKR